MQHHPSSVLRAPWSALVLVAVMSRLVSGAAAHTHVFSTMLKSNDVISYGSEEEISISFQNFMERFESLEGECVEILMPNESETQSIFMAHKLKSLSCTSSSAPFFSLKGKGRGKTERTIKEFLSPSEQCF